jgi:L-asparaginase II
VTTGVAFAAAFAPAWIGERGAAPDFVHLAALAACDPSGRLVRSLGDPDAVAFLRSSAKPFQVVAFLRRGLRQRLGLTAAEVACACASHSGEVMHAQAARRILAAAGTSEDALLCGTHPPFTEHGERLPGGPQPITNNCSGKHAAMLATCLFEGWPTATYTDPQHPLQVENRATLAAHAGVAAGDVICATDNCTVPTFALPLRATARAMARLVDPSGLPPDVGEAGRAALQAMAERPELVGGTRRLDTEVMEVTRGRLVVKTGASGFHVAAQRDVSGAPALGFAMKLAGGEGEAAKAPVVLACLHACGLLADDEHAALRQRWDLPYRNCRGGVVGRGRFIAEVRTHA